VQRILKFHPVGVYSSFVMAMAANGGVVEVSSDK